jgi:hypothetical protein
MRHQFGETKLFHEARWEDYIEYGIGKHSDKAAYMMPLKKVSALLQYRRHEYKWQLLLKVKYDENDTLIDEGDGYIILDEVNIDGEQYSLTSKGIFTIENIGETETNRKRRESDNRRVPRSGRP